MAAAKCSQSGIFGHNFWIGHAEEIALKSGVDRGNCPLAARYFVPIGLYLIPEETPWHSPTAISLQLVAEHSVQDCCPIAAFASGNSDHRLIFTQLHFMQSGFQFPVCLGPGRRNWRLAGRSRPGCTQYHCGLEMMVRPGVAGLIRIHICWELLAGGGGGWYLHLAAFICFQGIEERGFGWYCPNHPIATLSSLLHWPSCFVFQLIWNRVSGLWSLIGSRTKCFPWNNLILVHSKTRLFDLGHFGGTYCHKRPYLNHLLLAASEVVCAMTYCCYSFQLPSEFCGRCQRCHRIQASTVLVIVNLLLNCSNFWDEWSQREQVFCDDLGLMPIINFY